ncbi:thiaminase II [Leuconostoc gelidum]|uniref:Aminopyrimidine aminohydrolase n=1 Tax=Leuconostoc gelidum subsp. gelidum TaxID=1607839 RepID=A0AB35G1P1_LEUGE|nr:thiaminase II [Leuconostoc gelidum]AFS39899.1 thiaminase-2 [Leuconostoc gelidum JB7]MBZ5964578.1 thiaminase II [Leuconostoc gelidum subsp. gelidum]MBZ5974817.1 thiaminase II [Leuconostoc gelidum subsp. gelidum]MBZ5977657.1 thiaminase II [Leuconostoc gelidum subsp. gelidum]MBZ5986405.1 thiaminase II [Leuconostoc gelidum subsp. gelidum]
MTFSQDILTRAQPIMDTIMVHPFVKGIATGNVPDDILNYYVEQDEHYLKDYLQVTALTVTKTNDTNDIARLLETAQFISNESKAHEIMLNITGHHVENWRRSPDTQRYTDHMYTSAYHGTYADALAVLLPCAWSYGVIGRELVAQGANNDANPLKEWIEIYSPQANDEIDYNAWRFDALERAVANLNDSQKEQVIQTFLKSLEMEWRFWEAAWNQTQWRFDF